MHVVERLTGAFKQMLIPDLIIVGFSVDPATQDITESVRRIKGFRSLPYHTRIVSEFRSFGHTKVATITVDDPDYVTEDVHVLFLVTPTEQKYESIKNKVKGLTKTIQSWFDGTLYFVEHEPLSTFCSISKRKAGEFDEPVKEMVEHSVLKELEEWYIREQESSTSTSQVVGVPEASPGEDDRDHSYPDNGGD